MDARCREYEQAVEMEAQMSEELRRHAESCPRCCALSAAASLTSAPVVPAAGDPFVQAMGALARQTVAQRMARGERARRLLPLLIGLLGWSVGGGSFVLVARASLPGPPQPDYTSALPSLPAPAPAQVVAVLVICTVWTLLMVRRLGRPSEMRTTA